MDQDVILCGSNAYNKKYYLNPVFEKLPTQIKEELQIICVLFTEEVGGSILMSFDEDGELSVTTSCNEGDLLYDDVGAGLLIKKVQEGRADFFKALELYYKIFVLGQKLEDIED